MGTASTDDTTKDDETRRGPILEVLRELLDELSKGVDGRDDAIFALVAKLVSRNAELERRLAEMLMRRRPNEGVSTAQLRLFLDELDAADGDAATGELGDEERDAADGKLREASGIDEAEEPRTVEAPKQPPMRRKIPETLRRVDNPIAVPVAERACPVCGADRKCIGHDITEVIELVPAELIVRRDRREKLACEDCEGELVRAPRGDTVVEGGRLGTTLVAHLLVDKYRDGLPLHRQKQRFDRMGMSLPVSTLADQVTWATDLLRPLWRATMVAVLNSTVMQLDATGLKVLDRDARGGKKLGSLWGYVGDEQTALYLYASTGKKKAQRKGELGPEDVLALRKGLTVADAANVFEASFKRDDLIECGCNMHARRYFVKALDRGDKRAALPLAAYKKLYAIEDEFGDLAAAAKLSERQARSKPVFDEIVSWCTVHQPHEPPSSPLGNAIRYLLNQRDALGRFLDHPEVPIDNGAVERLHVRAALTRKNYLFAGSDAGAERAAIAYTILGSCALAGVNPVEYLTDMLPRLIRRIRIKDMPDMLPARWKLARSSPDS